MLGKIKKSMAGAKDKIKSAGAELLDSTQMKLSGKAFRVNGKKYKARRLIAEGGFGYVYLVEDELTGQLRALKHMIMQTKESRDSTLREIDLHTSLPPSQYLVGLIGSEVVKGPPDEAFVVMELCQGGNLADVINPSGPGGRGLSETRIWDIFYQVCQAVAILHEQSPIIIHRDIKAENVLISEDGIYKLCDFGSAKREMVFPSSESVRNQIQEDIDRFTTMVYRSPEMVDLYMEKWISDKVDIWALGCLLFKMAYVVTPFEEGGRLGILNAKVEFPITASSASYSDNLRNTIKWLLTSDPDARPNIFEVLERVAKYNGTTFNRNGRKAPVTPPYPAGFGSASSTGGAASASFAAPSSGSSNPTSARGALFDALDWQSTSGGGAQGSSGSANAFLSGNSNDFFSASPQPQFSPAPTFSSDSSFSSSSGAFGSGNGASGGADWAAFDSGGFSAQSSASPATPPFGAFNTPSPSIHVQVSSSGELPAPKAQHPHTANSLAVNSSNGRSHRRSVSDSSAITASLSAMQIRDGSSLGFGASGMTQHGFGSLPVVHADISRIPILISSILSLPNNGSSSGSLDSRIPPNAHMRELLTYTWAEPRQAHVSKVFQTLAPKLFELSPLGSLKGLYAIHRLLCEGSDLVLTLCNNKLDFFKKLATHFETASSASGASASTPALMLAERYAQYLVKKLEFHAAFDACFEGSYALDVYFQKLRLENKKLQIGAADSPLRRQAVPALLDLQASATSVLDLFLTPAASPDASSLKLHLSLPVFSDLCAILLLLQYITTKLLATKTDFSKAIATYEEQYTKMAQLFAKFTAIANSPPTLGFPATDALWAQSIKIPAFSSKAPAIVKGSTSVASPPSLDPSVSSTPLSIPQCLIYDPLTPEEQHEAAWMWTCLVTQASPGASPDPAPAPHFTVSQNATQAVHAPVASHHLHGHPQAIHGSLRNAHAIVFETPSFTPPASGTPPPLPTFTPPPTFTPDLSSSGGAAQHQASFDPFHPSGFVQGDPFSMSPSPSLSSSNASNPPPVALSASGQQQYNSSGGATFAVDFGSTFTPSTSGASVHTHDFFDTGMSGSGSGSSIVPVSPPPARRPLAASSDHFESSSGSGNKLGVGRIKTHKKRTSDSGKSSKHGGGGGGGGGLSIGVTHSSSGPSVGGNLSPSSSSDSGIQTSEDKLKNKEYLAAQLAQFQEIQALPGNSTCFDCGDNAPKWLSLNLGVFICFRCSGIHRSFGTHISKVRSVQLDVLTPDQIAFFKKMGNVKAAQIWLANVPDERTIPDRNTAQSDLEKFLRDKYVFEEFKAAASSSSSSKKGHSRNLSHQY